MDKEIEVWKDIPNYEGIYQVSNLGNVKSLARVVVRKDGVKVNYTEKILRASKNKYGYNRVVTSKNGKNKGFLVHQLVAMAFLNHEPCGYDKVVDHINNNQLDNRLENLQIITARENCSKDRKRKNNLPTGVWLNYNGKYVAQAHINGDSKYLGQYSNPEDASKAYLDAIK